MFISNYWREKKKFKHTHTHKWMKKRSKGREIDNLTQLDEKWHNGNFRVVHQNTNGWRRMKGPRDKTYMDEKWSKTSFLHKGNGGLFISKIFILEKWQEPTKAKKIITQRKLLHVCKGERMDEKWRRAIMGCWLAIFIQEKKRETQNRNQEKKENTCKRDENFISSSQGQLWVVH